MALDVDGTLLTTEGKLAPGLRRAILELPEAIRVVIATGRRLSTLHAILMKLGLLESIVSVLNGALTIDLKERRVLASHALNVDLEADWAAGERSGLLMGAVYPSADTLDLFGGEGLQRIGVEGYAGLRTRPLKEACYLAAWGPKTDVDAWAEEIDQSEKARVYVYPEGPGWYHAEVTPVGIDKQVAVSALAHRLGISRRDVTAVGDGGNDTTLLAWAGLGVAMGNATMEAKEVADRVIGPSDLGGLTDFLVEMAQGPTLRKGVDTA